MSRYFKEITDKKISLSEYLSKWEGKELHKEKIKYAQISHILSILGDEQMPKEVIDVICESLDSSLHRYGTKCLSKESIKGIYEISRLFPELSAEALSEIASEYIEDLFTEFDLIRVLAMLIRTDGAKDETFETFMVYVKEKAEILEKRYQEVAWKLGFFYGHEYSYDFITYFKEFIVKHHITADQLYISLPDSNLVRQDEIQLRELSKKAKDCFFICRPVSYTLLEAYFDGEDTLEKFDDTFSYKVSAYGKEEDASFTKTDFLESIKKRELEFKKRI